MSGELFLLALQKDFEANGIAAVERVRNERPADYLKVIASLIPKEVHVKDDSAMDGLSEDELRLGLDAIRAAIAAQSGKKTLERTEGQGSAPESDRVH
jgi:hypothetical protein